MKPSFKPRRSIVLRAVRLFALVLTSAAAADSESTQSPKTTPQSLRAAEHQSAYEAPCPPPTGSICSQGILPAVTA
jgi:hypothetical protein